ncbi:hypothetical protein Salat_0658100 [Sesamum alatum]|uniref:Uncharacterized protein n=1 Tax=Sesamum alatum TaxID=300844 RepID=A0AAE1YRK8_9LAMI|nr:hypothetical protein Salat_0658100 [Sesamum alatum]
MVAEATMNSGKRKSAVRYGPVCSVHDVRGREGSFRVAAAFRCSGGYTHGGDGACIGPQGEGRRKEGYYTDQGIRERWVLFGAKLEPSGLIRSNSLEPLIKSAGIYILS